MPRPRLGVAALLVPGLLALAAAAAAADTRAVTDEQHRYQLEVPARWQPAGPLPDTGGAAVAGWRDPGSDAALAISRVDYPNPDAWRNRQPFFDEVENGLAAATAGFERLHRRVHRLGRVPAMDLFFRHRGPGDGDEIVLMRFLFFRTYSMTLALSLPAGDYRASRRALAALVDSFQPYFGD
jgi:hypothetical protein